MCGRERKRKKGKSLKRRIERERGGREWGEKGDEVVWKERERERELVGGDRERERESKGDLVGREYGSKFIYAKRRWER